MKDQIKLPKQWKHWCASARLRPHSSAYCPKGWSKWFYLKGHGRIWRVNCYGVFQCGDTYADFDRWALCNITEAALPKTRAEFIETVRSLSALQEMTK